MGCVPSLQRGEIVVFNIGNPSFGTTSVDTLLGDESVTSTTKVPAVRNENWERAKPVFKPFLEEAQQIRAEIAKGGIIGFGSRLEAGTGARNGTVVKSHLRLEGRALENHGKHTRRMAREG